MCLDWDERETQGKEYEGQWMWCVPVGDCEDLESLHFLMRLLLVVNHLLASMNLCRARVLQAMYVITISEECVSRFACMHLVLHNTFDTYSY